jgi:predicted Zn-dependent protease
MPLAFAGFARRMEAQADCLSIGYMEAAGYNPAALMSALERVAAPGPSAGLLSAHPAAFARIARVQREIGNRFEPGRQYAENAAALQEVQKRLAGLRDHTGKIVVGLWPSLR